jgi:hypothetical protein
MKIIRNPSKGLSWVSDDFHLRVILPCWYLILCFYERPLLSTVFGRLFQGGLPLRLNHY